MGTLLERNQGIAERLDNLEPLRDRIRQRLYGGNKAAVLASLNRDGSPVAPLKPSTLRRRQGSGPPRAPRGEASAIVAGFVVTVDVSAAGLVVRGGWPGFPAAKYLDAGTARMAARPAGWREEDIAWAMAELKKYVMGTD